MREKITFFRSYYNAIKRLPKEKQVEAYEAILDYALDGVESSDDPFICAMLELMKPNIDRSNELSDSASSRGKQGGRPKANESCGKLTKANESKKKLTKASESCEKLMKAEEEVEEEEEIEKEKEYTPHTPQGAERQELAQGELSHKEQRFLRFWAAYPKKKSKESARKAFFKLNPNDDLLCQMLRAVERQATTEQWRRQGGQFIPYPATWLNGGCWEDDDVAGLPLGRGAPVSATPPEEEPPGAAWRTEGFMSWAAYRQAYLAGEVRDRLWP